MAAQWLLGASLSGSTVCPTPQAVEQRAQALAGDLPLPRTLLSTDGVNLRLELRGEGDEPLADRQLEASQDCAGLAEAAGVIVAAWAADLRAKALEAPRLPRPSSPRPPGLPAVWEGSLGVGLSVASGPLPAFELLGEAAVYPGHGRFLARAGLWWASPRSISVGAGQARWSRAALTAGIGVEPWRGPARLQLHVDAALALLSLSGQGFAQPEAVLQADPGLGGGVRLLAATGMLRPWLGIGAWVWVRGQTLVVDGTTDRAVLPRYELLVRAGVALGGP
jgi:hypothetical protein